MATQDEKELIKEALREWLDEKWAAFGRWSAGGLGALVFGAAIYSWLAANGCDR